MTVRAAVQQRACQPEVALVIGLPLDVKPVATMSPQVLMRVPERQLWLHLGFCTPIR